MEGRSLSVRRASSIISDYSGKSRDAAFSGRDFESYDAYTTGRFGLGYLLARPLRECKPEKEREAGQIFRMPMLRDQTE